MRLKAQEEDVQESIHLFPLFRAVDLLKPEYRRQDHPKIEKLNGQAARKHLIISQRIERPGFLLTGIPAWIDHTVYRLTEKRNRSL